MPSSVPGSGPLVPTFNGFISNTMDGLMLFEACLSGKLHHVPRRPHDRERNQLIKSGSIFVYEENASGIKRWTDGVAWSPSRILGNFLIYRELEKPFAPGEKKRAMKRKRSFQVDGQPAGLKAEGEDDSTLATENHSPHSQSTSRTSTGGASATTAPDSTPAGDNEREMERQLIGSLVDSYGFRPNGLVKKTMSVSVNGVSHHLVSYYNINDVKHRNLPRPYDDPRLLNLKIRPELYLKQNFRTPVEETEHYRVDNNMNAHPYGGYNQIVQEPMGYGMRPTQPIPQPSYGMYGGPAPPQSNYGSMHSSGSMWPPSHSQSVHDGYGRTPSNVGLNDGYRQSLPSVSDGYGRQSGIPQGYSMSTGYGHHNPSHASAYSHPADMRRTSPPASSGPPAAHGVYGHHQSIDHTAPAPYSNYRMVYGDTRQ